MKFVFLATLLILISNYSFASAQKVNFQSGVLTTKLDNPWAIVPNKDGSLFVTELKGNIKVFKNGKLDYQFKGPGEVYRRGQGGLLDLAFHPNFASNSYVYLSYSIDTKDGPRTRVSRFTLKNKKLSNKKVLVEGGTGTDGAHFGSRLVFDSKNRLYITIGERHRKELAQSLKHFNGKVLRINDDGSVPKDNPFVGNKNARAEIFSYGHRNPQGLDIHPVTSKIYITEHGPSGYDAPGGGDELNLVESGKNYGWPKYHHSMSAAGIESPLKEFTPAVAPSGAAFYRGSTFPQWKNSYFFANLRGRSLMRYKFDGKNVLENEVVLKNIYGRLRDVASGTDGNIYLISTSGSLIQIKPK